MSFEKELDFVVYGATGFTGKLVVEYINSQYSFNDIKWAMAGRNLEKLAQVKNDLNVVCIDIAHGDHILMEKAIDYTRSKYPHLFVIAGNIATASPIGDTLPLLLSLDAKVVLQSLNKKTILPIKNFFVSYRKTKLKKRQFIHSIIIPIFKEG